MGETWRFWLWFSILCLACAFAGVASVIMAIQGPVA